MRSGMRSWSKCVIFSRRMKSSSSAGPRSPAFREFWLSAIRTPWLVVRARPEESTRVRSSGPLPGLIPTWGLPWPAFMDALTSERVLPPTIGSRGSWAWPTAGSADALPNSEGFALLHGKAAASSSVPAILAVARSGLASKLVFRVGPLTVDLADACDCFEGRGRDFPVVLRFAIGGQVHRDLAQNAVGRPRSVFVECPTMEIAF